MVQSNGEDSRPSIESWKVIAHYFGRSIRSVQGWEREGLKIHRFQGRVWAYVDELEEFRASRHVGPKPTDPVVAPPAPEPRRRRFWALLGVAVLTVIVAVAGVWKLREDDVQLASYQTEGNLLKVLDENGKIAFTHRFETPAGTNLTDTQYNSQFTDINGDGKLEFLFPFQPPNESTILYCFRADGEIAWKFRIGREIVNGLGQPVLDHYVTTRLAVLERPRRDGGRIFVSSHHFFSWPHQIAVLTGNGKQVAEYWHPGWISSISLGDLNGDGIQELFLGGVNNSYGDKALGATLVVLDSRSVGGEGPVRPGDAVRRIPGTGDGRELAVLFFPEIRKDATPTAAYARIDSALSIDRHLELRLGAGMPPYLIHYELDEHLRVVDLAPSDAELEHLYPNVDPSARRQRLWKDYGSPTVLRNAFAAK